MTSKHRHATYFLLSIAIAVIATIAIVIATVRPDRAISPPAVSASAAESAGTIDVLPAPTPQTEAQPTSTSGAQSEQPNVVISISGVSYAAYAPPGSSVLDAMRALADGHALSFSGRDYSGLGFFVDAINGKKNADDHYWFLYVNASSSQTGASRTILKPGDVVDWRYEKNY